MWHRKHQADKQASKKNPFYTRLLAIQLAPIISWFISVVTANFGAFCIRMIKTLMRRKSKRSLSYSTKALVILKDDDNADQSGNDQRRDEE